MTAHVRSKTCPQNVRIGYAEELEKLQFRLKSSHIASTDAARCCELLSVWLEHPLTGLKTTPPAV